MLITRTERIVYDYKVAKHCCKWCRDRVHLFDGVPLFEGRVAINFCPRCGEPVTKDWED